MGYLSFAGTILGGLFKKPVTTQYPLKPAVLPEELRGRVLIDIQKCISCGMCMRKCPAGAIVVDRGAKSWTINRFACVQCATCVDNCPVKCLRMEPQYAAPGTVKKAETFVKQAAAQPAVAVTLVKGVTPTASAPATGTQAAAASAATAAKTAAAPQTTPPGDGAGHA